MARLMAVDEEQPAGAEGEPAPKRVMGEAGPLRRSFSAPSPPVASGAASALLPAEEPVAPAAPAAGTSPFKGVSRALWSTRWDTHVPDPAVPGRPALYCGSFDSEERAARAHDVAQLHFALTAALAAGQLSGPGAGAAARAALAAAQRCCNFAIAEYAGVEELIGMPIADFVASMLASSREPCERRYSKYRGVYRPEGAAQGAEQWEGRLEEAPNSARAALAAEGAGA